MRVIAGTAGSVPLKTLPGNATRPTTDRIKETLFNMIGLSVSGSVFLDLYSGSGAVGIEALSRGASEAVFIEKNPKACRIIKENLEKTRLSENAEILSGDAVKMLGQLADHVPFDIVFLDPPYDKGEEERILPVLAASGLLTVHTVVILETSLHPLFNDYDSIGFKTLRQKDYKTNRHMFLSLKGD